MKMSTNARNKSLEGGKEGEAFMAACKDELDSPSHISAILYS